MTEEFIKDYFLENHITLEALLKMHRLTFQQAEQLQKEFAVKFHAIAVQHDLRTDGLLQFCTAFLERIETECSDDLHFFYLAALTDCGLLFPVYAEDRTQEQNVRCYLEQCERMQEFDTWLQTKKPLIQELSALKSTPCRSRISVSERSVQEEYKQRRRKRNMLHHMKLQSEPFHKIKNGRKTIELRLNDEKRQQVRVGDFIEFSQMDDPSQRLTVRVIALHHFDSFAELYATLPKDTPWNSLKC